MSLQSCSDSVRFFQELYTLTTNASQGRSVTQENVCRFLGLVGDERVNGKPGRRGWAWVLWVASVCDGGGQGRRTKVPKER